MTAPTVRENALADLMEAVHTVTAKAYLRRGMGRVCEWCKYPEGQSHPRCDMCRLRTALAAAVKEITNG